MAKRSIIQTNKTVSETLTELRELFKKQEIEDFESIPAATGLGYSVRYLRGSNWTEIGSTLQPSKADNLRVCFQVIDNMFRWEKRGVSGLVKGTSFIGGALVVTVKANERESFDEACGVLGIEPSASGEEIKRIFQVKAQYVHADHGGSDERMKRLQKAYDLVMKVKGQ